jgi:Short C-terminal domain
MDSELTGALISAAASIVVALISKTDSGKSTDACAHSPRITASIQPWIATCAVLGAWFLASPRTIQPALAFLNFLSIPLAAMALAWFRPIQPLIAASVTLGLFAVNWIGWRIAHAGTGFRANYTHLLMFLSLACASAALVFLLSRWRCKAAKARPILRAAPPARSIAGMPGSIAGELERLAELYRSGVLSDDEFSRGKEVILGRPRRIVAHRNAQLAV